MKKTLKVIDEGNIPKVNNIGLKLRDPREFIDVTFNAETADHDYEIVQPSHGL